MAQAPKNDDKHGDHKHDYVDERQREQDSQKPAVNTLLAPDPDLQKERVAAAGKLFDEYEKEAKEDPSRMVTSATDQIQRSLDMESVGPSNWMNEMERRIQERQGDTPPEPRQVRGIAQAERPIR